MILANLLYPFGHYVMPRSRLLGLCFIWWDGTYVLVDGNPFLFQDVLYGGYRVHVKLIDWCWQWSVKTIHLDNVVEELWAYAPGSGVPVYAGNVDLFGHWSNEISGWFICMALAPFNQARWYLQAPTAPPTFYNPPHPNPVTYPFLVP